MGMVYCRGCAKEIHESATTCPHCGAIQNPVQVQNSGEVSLAILIIGYICTFLFPIVAIGIGIYVLVKGKIGHGIAMLGLSLFFVIAFLAVIS